MYIIIKSSAVIYGLYSTFACIVFLSKSCLHINAVGYTCTCRYYHETITLHGIVYGLCREVISEREVGGLKRDLPLKIN